MSLARVLLAVAHLVVAGVWLGAMTYSLGVVQPAVARCFADEAKREEFLLTLAHGNRWKVVAMLAALLATAAALLVLSPPAAAPAYAAVMALYLVAGAVFVHVSWRHWPARVFATPAELPGFRRRLVVLARVMLALVAAAFVVAVSAGVAMQ